MLKIAKFVGIFVILAASILLANNHVLAKVYNEPVSVHSSLGTDLSSYFYQGSHFGLTNGDGGVLFTNGTIVNASLDEYGNSNIPVTFGDDARIDGEIWRGPSKGISDNQALKISDTIIPTMTNINDIGAPNHRWKDIYYMGTLHGAVATFSGDLTANSVAYFNARANFGGGYGSSGVTIDTAGNIQVNGDIIVDGDVDGVNVSDENAVVTTNDPLRMQSTGNHLLTPSGNTENVPSRIVTGIARVTCPIGGGTVNTTIDLSDLDVPSFSAWNSYIVFVTDEGGVPEAVSVNNNSSSKTASSFVVYKSCSTGYFPYSVINWMAVGY